VYQVSAISDWRYSKSEHAAAALLGTPPKPDMFELQWETEPKSGTARSRKERTWEPISNITGGYASPLVQSFLRKHYLSTLVPAATAGELQVMSRKRNAGMSLKKPSGKRPKKAASADCDPSAAAAAAAGATAVPIDDAFAASPPVEADSQALTVRRPSLSRQLSHRSTRSSGNMDDASEGNTASRGDAATAARKQIELLASAALEDEHMSAADVLFFDELVKLLYPAAPPLQPQTSATATAAAVDAAPTSLLVACASSMLSQATLSVTRQQS